ncbi:hypothetical protein BASA62_006589 [Batrachochytrium salamandrivorans]|nr:hypothetical protein BASA62_006589 [Batrachochytrium salamandrivorans]
MLVSSVIALLAISSTSVSAANYAKYNLLTDDRAAGRLVFHQPHLPKERSYYLTSRTLSLPLWSAADPFPTIKKLRENIKTITDEELQLGLTDAFVMIRDSTPAGPIWHHTAASMPPPGCDFYCQTPRTPPLFGEDYSKIQAGDELLAINGLSFVEWFKKNKFTSGVVPMNLVDSALLLNILLRYMVKINRLPSEDSITFQFKSRANPRTAILSMSRMSLDTMRTVGILEANCTRASLVKLFLEHLKRVCLLAQSSLDIITSQTLPLLSPRVTKWIVPEDPKERAAMEQMSSSEQKSVVPMNPTDVTKITWGIYKPESTNMGIIKLDSFSPEDVGLRALAVEKAVMIVRSLLANELKDTQLGHVRATWKLRR